MTLAVTNVTNVVVRGNSSTSDKAKFVDVVGRLSHGGTLTRMWKTLKEKWYKIKLIRSLKKMGSNLAGVHETRSKQINLLHFCRTTFRYEIEFER